MLHVPPELHFDTLMHVSLHTWMMIAASGDAAGEP